MVLAGREWVEESHHPALYHGKHQSTISHVPFLREEFLSMVGKGKLVVLTYSVAKDLPGLRLSPPRVREEQ